jgi:hypothetical protein
LPDLTQSAILNMENETVGRLTGQFFERVNAVVNGGRVVEDGVDSKAEKKLLPFEGGLFLVYHIFPRATTFF